MRNKEAVLKLEVFMPFNLDKMNEQQAIDKVEELVLEMQDKIDPNITIDVKDRFIKK